MGHYLKASLAIYYGGLYFFSALALRGYCFSYNYTILTRIFYLLPKLHHAIFFSPRKGVLLTPKTG